MGLHHRGAFLPGGSWYLPPNHRSCSGGVGLPQEVAALVDGGCPGSGSAGAGPASPPGVEAWGIPGASTAAPSACGGFGSAVGRFCGVTCPSETDVGGSISYLESRSGILGRETSVV